MKIYNTLGRQLEEFKPIVEGKVRFYQCGPTVYWTQHLGNMRAMVMSDLIRRAFVYSGYDVEFVRNYTDVGHLTSDGDTGEDKMSKGAAREGLSPDQIAQKYIDIFEQDIAALNVLPANASPRATLFVQQMIQMVQILLDKEFAYITPTAVYFDISKAADYTKLSGQNLEMNKQGAGHGDVGDEHKRNPADFSLWFFKTGAHKSALQTWTSPFNSPEVENGEGFPGWHIECSAMIKALLGDTIDIHMGGVEHIPVHHTNEIAQSEAANGTQFVNYWLHNEHLNVEGGKMSKSDGTGWVLSDILEKGYEPMAVRYFFLQAHYRSKQNVTWEALDAAASAHKKLLNRARELHASSQPGSTPLPAAASAEHTAQFRAALSEDFNIPQALAVVWDMLKSDLAPEQKLATLLDFDQVLGLKLESTLENPVSESAITSEVQQLLDQRQAARAAKNWPEADRLREVLSKEYGIEVKDSAEGQSVL